MLKRLNSIYLIVNYDLLIEQSIGFIRDTTRVHEITYNSLNDSAVYVFQLQLE